MTPSRRSTTAAAVVTAGPVLPARGSAPSSGSPVRPDPAAPRPFPSLPDSRLFRQRTGGTTHVIFVERGDAGGLLGGLAENPRAEPPVPGPVP